MKNKVVDKGKYLLEKSNFSNFKNSKIGIGIRKVVKKINNFLDKRIGSYTYRTITCCTLILVGLIMVLVMAFGGKEKVLNYPILFVNSDEELMIYGKGSKEAIKIANLDGNEANVAYGYKSERNVLYMKDNNLYFYDFGKKDDSVKIGVDVVAYGFNLNDKYVYYINDENELYYSDKKNKGKIDSDVDKVVAALDEKILYVKDDSLYIKSYNEKENDKEKITNEFSNARVSEDEKKVLIASQSELYVYTISNNDKKEITDKLDTVINYSENFEKIIYTTKSSESQNVSSLLIDNLKEEDEKFKEISYNDYLNEKVSYEEYTANREQKEKIEVRNSIREYVEEYEAELLIVNVYEKGKSKEIIQDINRVINVDKDLENILYFKGEFGDKLNIEDYDSKYDFISDFEGSLNTNQSLYVFDGKNEVVISDEEEIADALILGKNIYYLVNEEDGYELFHGKLSGKEVKDIKSLDSGINGTFKRYFEDEIFYFADVDDEGVNGDLKVIKNDKVENVATDVFIDSIQVNKAMNKMYYLKDYDGKEGNLYLSNGNKEKKLTNNVTTFVHINDNYMYLMKNYSDKNETIDLYIFDSKNEKLVSENVAGMANSLFTVKYRDLYY